MSRSNRAKTVFLGLFVIGVAAIHLSGNRVILTAHASASGPIAGVTGAPSEGDCTLCHTTLSGELGQFTITAPSTYMPGNTYQITVTHVNTDDVTPRMKWGFELTALTAAGTFRWVTFRASPRALSPKSSQVARGATASTSSIPMKEDSRDSLEGRAGLLLGLRRQRIWGRSGSTRRGTRLMATSTIPAIKSTSRRRQSILMLDGFRSRQALPASEMPQWATPSPPIPEAVRPQ